MDDMVESLKVHGISSEANEDAPDVSAAPPDASISAQDHEALCSVCREVNLREFLLGDQSPSEIQLGHLTEIVRKTDCALCSLVVKALERNWTAMPLYSNKGLYWGFQPNEIFLTTGKATALEDDEDSPRTIEIEVRHEGRRCEGRCAPLGYSRDGEGEENYQAEFRLLPDREVTLDNRAVGYGREITTACDTDLLSTWYDQCKAHHDDRNCGTARIVNETSLPPETRFIDVEELRLVPVSETCEFAALSYVWGALVDEDLQTKSYNVEIRQEHDGLRQVMLPRTIADAISVTRELRLKYLWIDSLCIIQDDENKKAQIQNMDRIYGLASLVLVAAAGTDATAGLVGYKDSPRPGIDQETGSVQGLRLVVSSPPLQYVLENSKWNKRGWTFQEWHLARRALIFTDQQVYYVCSSSSFCEDIALEQVQPHSAVRLIMENCNASTWRHYLPSRYSRFTVNSGWIDYIQTMEKYSERELTYESDTLLAISGLLNNLYRASRNRFLCGLSIGFFHDALFWIPVNGSCFRGSKGGDRDCWFPTWSWAGWKGTVTYSSFPASDRSLIGEWAVWTDEEIGKLGTPLSEPQNDRLMPGIQFFSDPPRASDTEAEARRRGTGILGPNHLHPCFLKFRAEIATLQISGGTINDFSSRAEALLDRRGPSMGAYMGVAILNKQRTPIERLGGSFRPVKCIAISVSRLKIALMNQPAHTTLPADEEWVNLIIVVELESEICGRIGVGQVSKRAWENWAKPESREIKLA